eukprot:TRINITY_DN3234_c0_g1_i11.p1 TRINITY_DN3234_c0_g1~~TRINITY_DN3234_c0_g1_i11.p1  ORF type:complete len:321 (+),score=39.82 TRINITY_DN3234_c0_g1_i11:65-1027(+)
MGDSNDKSDKSLARAVNLSLRFICLMLTGVVLLTIVGYIFVAIQAIWTKGLRAEVDQLADTNSKLEENNRRFKESNGRLEREVIRLEDEVDELNVQITEFTTLNNYLREDLDTLEQNKEELQNTVTNITEEGDSLQNSIDDFQDKTSELTGLVGQLNTSAVRLRYELDQFKSLEENLGSFSNSSKKSLNTILDATNKSYKEVINMVLDTTETVLQNMANNLELSDAEAGFSQSEYNSWMARIALVLPYTQQQLLTMYPYSRKAASSNDITEIIKEIIEKQKSELVPEVQKSLGLPWLSEGIQEGGEVEHLKLRRALSFII